MPQNLCIIKQQGPFSKTTTGSRIIGTPEWKWINNVKKGKKNILVKLETQNANIY